MVVEFIERAVAFKLANEVHEIGSYISLSLSSKHQVNPIRILHCIPNLTGGGAERQLCLLARGLAAQNIEVHIAYVPGGENDGLVTDGTFHLHHLSSRSSYDPNILLQLISLIRQIKPDIIQTWLPQMDFLAGVAARILRRPFILSERSSAGAYAPSLRTFARKLAGRLANAVVANSTSGLAIWSKTNRSTLSRVIQNGIPDEEPDVAGIDPYRDPTLEQGEKFILFVGRYHTDKNALLAADAIIAVLKQRPTMKALFLGQGPLRSELLSRVRLAGLEDRFVIGPYASNTRFWMAKASAFVSVSAYEGHPNAVIEAAFVGAPLILSDIPPHREIFTNSEVYYGEQLNSLCISNAIKAALDEGEETQAKIARAKQKVARFDLSSMISAYLLLYRDVCARTRT